MSRTAKQSKKKTKQTTKYVSRRSSRCSRRAKLLKPPCSRITRPRFKQGAFSRTKLPGAAYCFTEHTYPGADTARGEVALPPQDTSTLSMYSYGVVNRGKHPALVQIQISPNAVDYAVDSQEVVEGGQTKALVPLRFLHYTRLVILPVKPGEPTRLDVYFQAQRMP
ncbi:hypothetical protein GCM10008014_46690 [Paenibacillus silvae]|uniref:DUF6385 domain-containing protein n=1 Tax=Paenibacillus silvae TaxID=1325358 RepID=A0ABQ1ZH30_9BACL|nr:DUF6385 domain-containing protein [Paenibacillus silvae]GGH66357.1 hypothetical protein GCM10008014_46690 [Paenibacillus silvae]